MSGNGSQHPARAVEFLSRLHDGDLDPSERARFEAHRAHCAECRRAAVEFEDAISLFRSSRSMPPRADLAARILRKVQSRNRPRAPFSPRFRLDLAAAALLATALLAILISTPLTLRRAAPTAPPAVGRTVADPSPAAIPSVPQREGSVVSRNREVSKSRIPARPEPILEKREARTEVAQKSNSQQTEVGAVADRAPRPAEADQRKDRLSRAVAGAESPALAAGGSEEPPPAAAQAAPLRLTIHSVDGYGAAPSLLPGGPVELSREERGREYVLLLDSQGVVREVRPSPAPAAIFRLHFRPGSRPRRVLVRVE